MATLNFAFFDNGSFAAQIFSAMRERIDLSVLRQTYPPRQDVALLSLKRLRWKRNCGHLTPIEPASTPIEAENAV